MGSGSWLLAQITGPAKDNGKGARAPSGTCVQAPDQTVSLVTRNALEPQGPQAQTGVGANAPGLSSQIMITDTDHESNQANRAISTSKLNTSPRLHTWPINVVVFHGSQGILVLRWVSRLDAFSGYPVRT